MAPLLVNLRPNRHLMDHNFYSYKQNSQSLPLFSCHLKCRVDRVFPDEAHYAQFPFNYEKLFAAHNHLVFDQFDGSFNNYYIDNNRQVRLITFDTISHTFETRDVYDIPVNVVRKSLHFNPCLSFPSSDLALVSDGTGYLYILKTGPRNRPRETLPWENVNTFLVLGEDKYFYIVDSRVQQRDKTLLLHCLLQSVEHNYINFTSILTWVTYSFNDKIWKQTSFRRIEGKGTIHYAAIEKKCGALYIASKNCYRVTKDSEKIEVEDLLDEIPNRVIERKLFYTWHQSPESLYITLKLEPNFKSEYFQCEVNFHSIKVTYAGKNVVDGKLAARVIDEFTTWSLQDNGQVDIHIIKYDANMWDDLLNFTDETGEQIIDPTTIDVTNQSLTIFCSEVEGTPEQPLPGLPTQQLDENFTPSADTTVLVRVDISNHKVTHRVSLSRHHLLFNIRKEPDEAPALGFRHGNDVCIWQPYAQLINSNLWPVIHQGSLMAFGYLQSTKQNKKCVTCSPNFSYSVVCDSSKQILIYQSPKNSDNLLNDRSEVNAGTVHIFNIGKFEEVVGINATNEFLFILTETKLIAIQVQ